MVHHFDLAGSPHHTAGQDPHKPKSGKDNVYMEEGRKGNGDKKCGG
jgi:hypothetical protein